MNPAILEEVVQHFIDAHLKDDVHKLAMSTSPFSNVSAQELAAQILAKRRSEKKLPSWFNTSGIYYPQMISIEQCSSEKTATYKSTLILGDHVLDLTGGFGVDCVSFSKQTARVIHCELIPELSEIAAYNARRLQIGNIQFLNTDGIAFLNSTSDTFSTIYIDPARRGKSGKVFMLKDCSPNVVEHLDLLLSKASRVIIKTSPLLDISAGIKELRNVTEVQIISVKNECKELLFILEAKARVQSPKITSVTINEQIKKVTFGREIDASNSKGIPEQTTHAPEAEEGSPSLTDKSQSSVKGYLYEPDVALLKSGEFNAIGKMFDLMKLDAQSHLYTSNQMNIEFPGRIFQLNGVLTKKELKKEKDLIGNVIVRNYPAKPDDLIKAFKIKPSQNEFLIFTKIHEMGYVILKASIIQHY
jgi:protein-L-isoaspartate O-methyltransferase